MTEVEPLQRDAPPSLEATSGVVASDGADIYYEYGGQGPVLLMIPGGGGDAGAYARPRQHLASDYTVVSYDWRGHSRSSGDLDGPATVDRHSGDAVAVIKAMGVDSALVFGSSGGAIIALDMVAHHPDAVVAALVHEPPTVWILPDARHWLRHFDELHELAQKDLQAAAARFFSDLVGIDPTKRPPELQARLDNNLRRTLTREIPVFVRYMPDVARIRANDALVIVAAGSGSAGHYYARTAPILAGMLASPYVEFPGYHDSWVAIPEEFAAKVRQVFAGYRDLAVSRSTLQPRFTSANTSPTESGM